MWVGGGGGMGVSNFSLPVATNKVVYRSLCEKTVDNAKVTDFFFSFFFFALLVECLLRAWRVKSVHVCDKVSISWNIFIQFRRIAKHR